MQVYWKAPINLGRKWMYRMVVGTLWKKELLKKIEDKTGVKAGEKDMYYSKNAAIHTVSLERRRRKTNGLECQNGSLARPNSSMSILGVLFGNQTSLTDLDEKNKEVDSDNTLMIEDCTRWPKEVVLWKEVIPRQEELIPLLYLPDGRKLWEFSRINRQEAITTRQLIKMRPAQSTALHSSS
ncbi:uncharacterized protein HD556DRAFT_1304348 [Suillus plorans]|uniref:Uncharacterized protein n=1 Tax=Suillus plorans TaxID=116603 RepID=A0A9P7DSV3_9AGAM|nr:uncharacterized protein HD556DRAFT_1304348 [Suillus plorans]KAG1802179.1 hypothetical protein HD556DRAFT_1304348 [Suillus plorans]